MGKKSGVDIVTPKYSCARLLSKALYLALFSSFHGGVLPLPCMIPPLWEASVLFDL